MYYLINRYYAPETGRFLSADDVSYLDPETIGGLNLYAYCNNNPVMNIDPEGNAWWEWLIAGAVTALLIVGAVATSGIAAAVLTGAAVGASLSMETQATSGEMDLGQFAIDTTVGAISGAFSFATGKIMGALGQSAGEFLSQATVGGLKIGKIITGNTLGTIGKKSGDLIGGFLGGMVFDKYSNQLFGKQDSLQERVKNNLLSSIYSEGLNFYKYLWNIL